MIFIEATPLLVKALLTLYSPTPGGLPGNDDGGTMSSWWVFAALGFYPAVPGTDVLALGGAALATFKLGIHQLKRGGFISDYDAVIGEKLARVLTGGDLNHETRVSEQYILDLEREAFLSLCGQRQTQERIAHMLKTGKPLRN